VVENVVDVVGIVVSFVEFVVAVSFAVVMRLLGIVMETVLVLAFEG